MGRIFQRPASHTEYTTEYGTVLVDNSTHKIVAVPRFEFHSMIGIEVYVSKGRLTSVETGEVIAIYKIRRKVHIQTTT